MIFKVTIELDLTLEEQSELFAILCKRDLRPSELLAEIAREYTEKNDD